MVKKFAGGNSKGESAREKKEAAAAEKQAKVDAGKAAVEDADWAKGAKGNAKKAQEEEKRKQQLAKKNEAAALLAAEEQQLSKTKPKAPLKGEAKKAEKRTQKADQFDKDLKNDLQEYSASNIDDALDLLTLTDGQSGASATDKIDRHPERRAKAAFNAYYERELPIAKTENPGLRLSQLKDVIWKAWQKSPENPFNAELVLAYNATQDEQREKVKDKEKQLERRLKVQD